MNATAPESVYIHVPFCGRKCGYCDFVSYPLARRAADAYIDALGREMRLERMLGRLDPGSIRTLYVGGGTPTALDSGRLAALADLIGAPLRADGIEATIEANPESADPEKLAALRRMGFNRLSLGFQSLVDSELETLGRLHDSEAAVRAFAAARAAGFGNIGVDLIFGIPGQTLESWLGTVARVLELEPEHVSIYNLSLSPGTEIHARIEAGALEALDEELESAMYYQARSLMIEAGLGQYELSNFARPGFECRHNGAYWDGSDYLGLGAAAHSRVGDLRWANCDGLDEYGSRLEANQLPTAWRSALGSRRRMAEDAMLALRATAGLDRSWFRAAWGADPAEVFAEALEWGRRYGVVEVVDDRIRLTAEGLFVSNELFRRLLPGPEPDC